MDENITTKEDQVVVVGEQPISEVQDSTTITFKRTHIYSVLLPLAFVVGLSVGYIFWGRDEGTISPSQPRAEADIAPTSNTAPVPQEIRRFDVPEDDDPVFGPSDAPITIIEFSDYECPYCRKWHLEVWPRLLEAYPDQIRLVYRDFPLTTIHPNATPAASAANCASEQGRYWEFNELLFSGKYSLGVPGYQAYASELELDVDAFNDCLDSGKYNEEIAADFEYAANLGVSSTPTFFVNGIPVVGAQPFEMFSQLINQELAGEIP